MRQISEEEEKPFKSSLVTIQKPAVKGWGGESNTSPSSNLFPSWSVNISFKDDVTVILLLGCFLHDSH
jgi:hypothetical protein